MYGSYSKKLLVQSRCVSVSHLFNFDDLRYSINPTFHWFNSHWLMTLLYYCCYKINYLSVLAVPLVVFKLIPRGSEEQKHKSRLTVFQFTWWSTIPDFSLTFFSYQMAFLKLFILLAFPYTCVSKRGLRYTNTWAVKIDGDITTVKKVKF